jgi:hypothetical protein
MRQRQREQLVRRLAEDRLEIKFELHETRFPDT